jgi:protocatechuate 3,4-dioxygenase beta subunit
MQQPPDNDEIARGGSLFTRRRALVLLGGAGLGAVIAGCSSGSSDTAASASGTATSSTTPSTTPSTTAAPATTTVPVSATTASIIPEETAGPFPADGSNGQNVLTQSGIVRADIRPSFGSATGVATGVPFTIKLRVLDTARGSVPLTGAAVYVWHCDRDGNYSMYSSEAENENYLRGVQVVDADGTATFTSVFPACYSGRWPHVHFEVYPDVATATAAGNKLATSQLALPKDVCDIVYATSDYSSSASNLSQVSLASDMVFSDGVDLETPTVTGSVAQGYLGSLAVGV